MRRYITKNIRFLFITILILIYISFITLDLIGGSIKHSNILKFTVIIICFCYALFSKSNNKSISYTLKTAMLFTLISDLFILVLDYYFYGVLTFIVVQLLYNYRISLYNCNTMIFNPRPFGFLKCLERASYRAVVCFISWLFVQLIIAAFVCFALMWLGVEQEPLLIASVIYFIGLLTNTIRAIIAALIRNNDNGMVLFAVGLVLFLLCDINVGLFNLTQFITIPQDIYTVIDYISSLLMWIFYAPSQALIALSIGKSK